ncbi:MAG: PqqD family peptide modification chaperone [Parasphingorhabdus sp.]
MFTELGDKTMTMNIDTGNYHELDSIGATIWREIEKPIRVDMLRDRLCARYEVSLDQCLTEMSTFLAELAELDMVIIGSELTAKA